MSTLDQLHSPHAAGALTADKGIGRQLDYWLTVYHAPGEATVRQRSLSPAGPADTSPKRVSWRCSTERPNQAPPTTAAGEETVVGGWK